MNDLSTLMTLIGFKKTLIIVCGEDQFNESVELNDRIYIYFLSENVLHQHDNLEKGRIQYYIENKKCTQIIFLGTLQKHLTESFEQDEAYSELRSILKFNLSVFLRNKSKAILSSPIRDQLLTEQHIIAQCNMLMDYYFIKNRVKNKQLNVMGLITNRKDEFKGIFCNGIIYNDIISMN